MTEWDFTSQQAATYYSVDKVLSEGKVAKGDRISLDLFFAPLDNANPETFLKALKTFGYLGAPQDDGSMQVTIDDLPLDAGQIWQVEERTSKLALPRGYEPDGWGFSEP